jgi:phosphomevalonate kinase
MSDQNKVDEEEEFSSVNFANQKKKIGPDQKTCLVSTVGIIFKLHLRIMYKIIRQLKVDDKKTKLHNLLQVGNYFRTSQV